MTLSKIILKVLQFMLIEILMMQNGNSRPEVTFKKGFLIHREAPVMESLFNKVNASSFIKKLFHYKCIFVSFTTILRATILQNICGQLLLPLGLD